MGITYSARLLKCDDPSPYTGKIYPTEEVKNAINDFMENSQIHLGEMDGEDPVINLDRVSHKINKTYVDDDGWWMAEIETVDTPMGEILKQLLEAKLPLRLAPRSTGVVNSGVGTHIISDLNLITIDVLAAGQD